MPDWSRMTLNGHLVVIASKQKTRYQSDIRGYGQMRSNGRSWPLAQELREGTL